MQLDTCLPKLFLGIICLIIIIIIFFGGGFDTGLFGHSFFHLI